MTTTDMSQYLDVFLDEGREQLVLLEANILEMERGNHTLEMLQVLFRAAHTLKGSSRAMGFLAIGDLTHEMENILDALRLDQLEVSTPIVNVLLDCLDALSTLVDSVGDSGTDADTGGKDIPALVARLDTLRTGASAPVLQPSTEAAEKEKDAAGIVYTASGRGQGPFPLADHEQIGANAAVEAGLSVYQIHVTLTEDCQMKSVRAWMVLSALEPLGSVLASDPSEEALEAEEFERSFRLLFAAETPLEEIKTTLGSISEMESVEVRAWKTPKLTADTGPLVLDRPFPVADHEQTSLDAAAETGLAVYQINLTLASDCQMKSVRAWMVLNGLTSLGSVLASDPNEETLDTEEFNSSFRLLFASDASQGEIETALSAVSEVETATVRLWKAPEPESVEPKATDAPLPNAAEKAPAAEKAVPSEKEKTAPQSQTIRVEVSRLDSLLNLVGELVIERAQMHRVGAELHQRYPRDEEAGQLLETTHRIARVTAELQDQIMKARMLPIDGVFQRMPRMVRDLAQKTGKEIQFEMSGGETELDRTVLEVLSDPLIHLLRNSVDHGVESPEGRSAAGKPAAGLVTMAARHEENHIIIEITDDGRGMVPASLKESAIRKGLLTEAMAAAMSDRDALGLIFASGFSTAAVLSDISGRGVGMDIVKSNLEKVGGRILVDSVVGKGSTFTIHLPLTLAIVRAVLVEATGGTYVLPLGSVAEMLRLGTSDGETAKLTLGGQAVINLRGRTIPLANLSDLLCGSAEATRPERISEEAYVVVTGAGDRQVGLCVEALVGEQEVVIKSMGTLLGDIPGLSGATILGDGRVALIVDVAKAVAQVGLEAQTHPAKTRRIEHPLAAHV